MKNTIYQGTYNDSVIYIYDETTQGKLLVSGGRPVDETKRVFTLNGKTVSDIRLNSMIPGDWAGSPDDYHISVMKKIVDDSKASKSTDKDDKKDPPKTS
jgi:hypothetical protein